MTWIFIGQLFICASFHVHIHILWLLFTGFPLALFFFFFGHFFLGRGGGEGTGSKARWRWSNRWYMSDSCCGLEGDGEGENTLGIYNKKEVLSILYFIFYFFIQLIQVHVMLTENIINLSFDFY